MIDRTHSLPLTRQATALGISRGALYYRPRPVSAFDLALMRRIDAVHLEMPWFGTRGPHSSLADRTPDEAYFLPRPLAAAA